MVLARLWLYRVVVIGVLLTSASMAVLAPAEYDRWHSSATDSNSGERSLDESLLGITESGDDGSENGTGPQNEDGQSEGQAQGNESGDESEDSMSEESGQPTSAEDDTGSGGAGDEADADSDQSTESSSDGDEAQASERVDDDGAAGTLFDEQESEGGEFSSAGADLAMPTRLLAMLLMAALCASVIFGMTAGALLSESVRTGLLLALVGPILAAIHRKQSDVQTRGRILGYVEAHPGIHFSALRDALGLANGVTAHHLYVLERGGEILSWTHGRNRRYAASGIDSKRIEEVRAPLTGMQLAIMETLSASGQLGLTATEIRTRLEASRQLMSYHLKQLKGNEMVLATGSGRKARWSLTDTAEIRMASQQVV